MIYNSAADSSEKRKPGAPEATASLLILVFQRSPCLSLPGLVFCLHGTGRVSSIVGMLGFLGPLPTAGLRMPVNWREPGGFGQPSVALLLAWHEKDRREVIAEIRRQAGGQAAGPPFGLRLTPLLKVDFRTDNC